MLCLISLCIALNLCILQFLEPAKVGSDIIERIADSRRQRHDAALEDMHQELGIISSVRIFNLINLQIKS